MHRKPLLRQPCIFKLQTSGNLSIRCSTKGSGPAFKPGRVLGSRPGLRVLTLPRLQLVDLTPEAKSEGLVEHARREFPANNAKFREKLKSLL